MCNAARTRLLKASLYLGDFDHAIEQFRYAFSCQKGPSNYDTTIFQAYTILEQLLATNDLQPEAAKLLGDQLSDVFSDQTFEFDQEFVPLAIPQQSDAVRRAM